MDSRIEELAQIIGERAGSAADLVRDAADGYRGDRYHSWRRMQALANEILTVISDYRRDHPKEYVDDSLVRARGQIKEAHEQIVSLRNELRTYREREKTMGWDQS